MTTPVFLDVLEELIESVVGPAATEVDSTGTSPEPRSRPWASGAFWAR